MSLERFKNASEIIQSNTKLEGLFLSNEDLQNINYKTALLSDISLEKLSVESHLYSPVGIYIQSVYNTPYKYYPQYKDFTFDLATLFDSLGVISGEYKVSMSFLINLLGNSDTIPLTLLEISPDRTELKLVIKKSYIEAYPEIRAELDRFKEIAGIIKTQELLNNIVINFGKNYIFNVTNLKLDCEDELIIYAKLYYPLLDELIVNQSCYISYKVLEDYIENIVLRTQEIAEPVTILKGPKLNDCSPLDISNETGVKTWNTLLDSDEITTAKLINSIISGSDQVKLNLDYSDFKNFVLYGSAEERIKNYDYKLKLLEYYSSQKSIIDANPASSSSLVSNLTNNYIDRSNKLLGTFDQFENFLYNTTGSIFSYDITGSITPNPKYYSQNKLINHSTTSSIYLTWYNSLIEDAKEYDRTNYTSFYFNTPDHILRDDNNSQYVAFLHMVGQHFDNLHNFIRQLTQIHRRDEHPQRGIPNELLPFYVKSLGWKIQNTRALSDLWLYKLGTDATGSFQTVTSDLISKSHENLSHQIWRRIVNNLPYLLKTKGSERSVRALFSVYGIPFTLISVKEYGGPQVDEENPPILAEDKFQYLLNLEGNQYIEIPRGLYTSSLDLQVQVPQTTEFRFRTNYTSFSSMSIWAVEDGANRQNVLQNLEVVNYTGSLYGVDTYAYLRYTIKSGSTNISQTSSLLPLLDDDIWTVRLYSTKPVYSGSSFDGTLKLQVAKSSDFVENRISLSSSIDISANPNHLLYTLGATTQSHYAIFGGTTGSNSTRFSGSVQSYREYFGSYSNEVFNQHVLNPSSYHANAYTSSYDQLFRYYPLGIDNLRFDHYVKTQISSSQPNQIFYGRNVAEMINFTGSQSQQYTSKTETHYRYFPSLGANNPKSNKIRLEKSVLVRQLSPESRAEVSRYDKEQKDSNRLAIVFSPTDQVNKDISNQFGAYNFENFVGDPSHATLNTYPDLRLAREDYFKKFAKANDIGKFIEIFSLYDYSVFEQVKQLVPARANLITGVLIEPHILERPKIKRTFPEINVLQEETTLPSTLPNLDPNYIPVYEVKVEKPIEVEIEREKRKTEIEISAKFEIEKEKRKTNIKLPGDVEVERSKLKGSESLNIFSISSTTDDLSFSLKRYYEISSNIDAQLDKYGNAITFLAQAKAFQNDKIEKGLILRQPFSNGQVVPTTNTFSYSRDGQTYTITITDDKYVPFESETAAVKRTNDESNIYDLLKYGVGSFYVYLSMVEVEFNISQLGNENYKFYFTTIEPDIAVVTQLNGVEFKEFLQKYNYSVFTGKNIIYKNRNTPVFDTYHISGSRLSNNYFKENYFYSSSGEFTLGQTSPNMLKSPVYLNNRTGSKSDYIRELDYAINKEYNAYYSSSISNANYQHFEDASFSASRFKGSKLVGAGINIDSDQTITGRPVVTVKIVNENDIIVQ